MLELEKFKSDVADIVNESKEEFGEEVDRLKSLLDFSFDSQYGSELAEAMKSIGIGDANNEIIEVSLEDGTVKHSQLAKDAKQNFSEFKDNISTTLNAHGELAKGYSAEYDKGHPGLDEFGQKVKTMSKLIKKLPENSVQKPTEKIEAVAAIGIGTNEMYSTLESSSANPQHVTTITKLGAGLRQYIGSFIKSPKEQKEALMESSNDTIQAINDIHQSDGLHNCKTALEKILNKLTSAEIAGSQLYQHIVNVLKKNNMSQLDDNSTIKPDATPSNTKQFNTDKGR